MTKELSIRCDASTVQGTSTANHDTYGSYFDSPNRRSLLWVIDGATPLEKEPYPSALYHIVRQLSATIEYKFKWYADRCQRVGLQQVLSEAIDQMRDAVALIAPTHGINSAPILMEGDNYKPTDADDAFWTSFGTFSITMIELDNDKPVINECLQLGDCGLLVRLLTTQMTVWKAIKLSVLKRTSLTATILETCLDEACNMRLCVKTSQSMTVSPSCQTDFTIFGIAMVTYRHL